MAKCAHCGKESESRDHVPPKCLFPRPRPNDLITVPCCAKCNSSASKDEEYFLAVYMIGDAGVSDAGKKLWKQKLRRMYQKNTGLRQRIAGSLIKVRMRTAGGLYLGARDAIQLDHDRLDAVVKKIVRGLYFHEFGGERLLDETRVDCMALDSQKKVNQVDHFAAEVRAGTRDWPGLFEYRRNRVAREPQGSLWFLRFYGRIMYWAITAPPALVKSAGSGKSR